MKNLLYILLILSCTLQLSAQQSHQDSVITIAKRDVKKHKLSRKAFKGFRSDRGNFRSDYLKPDSSTTNDYSLLKDSTYVQTYKEWMYKKSRTRRTTGHYFLVGGIIYTVASFLAAFAIILIIASGFNWLIKYSYFRRRWYKKLYCSAPSPSLPDLLMPL